MKSLGSPEQNIVVLRVFFGVGFVLVLFLFFFYDHFENNMIWKLFLPLISPCSSSVAVLAAMLWKRENVEASSQS